MTVAITVTLTLDLLAGPEQDADSLIDSFAGAVGEQNGAMDRALRVTVPAADPWDEHSEASIYKVTLVEDA